MLPGLCSLQLLSRCSGSRCLPWARPSYRAWVPRTPRGAPGPRASYIGLGGALPLLSAAAAFLALLLARAHAGCNRLPATGPPCARLSPWPFPVASSALPSCPGPLHAGGSQSLHSRSQTRDFRSTPGVRERRTRPAFTVRSEPAQTASVRAAARPPDCPVCAARVPRRALEEAHAGVPSVGSRGCRLAPGVSGTVFPEAEAEAADSLVSKASSCL